MAAVAIRGGIYGVDCFAAFLAAPDNALCVSRATITGAGIVLSVIALAIDWLDFVVVPESASALIRDRHKRWPKTAFADAQSACTVFRNARMATN